MNANLFILLSNVNSITSGDGTDKGKIIQAIKDGIVELLIWIVEGLFTILTPFIDWGCKSVIVISVIIFFCNKDKKAITVAMKSFFLFLIFMMIRGVVL